MARPKAEAPARRYHISGQSVVTLCGRDFYLGKHDSPESLVRYALLVSQYQSNGYTLPEGFSISGLEALASSLLAKTAPEKVHLDKEPITIGHLAEGYRKFVLKRYSKRCQQGDVLRRILICDALVEHDGTTPVSNFGPRKLKEYRERFISTGTRSRKYVNKLVNELRSVFKWGVGEELAEPEIVTALSCVRPLSGGEACYELEDRRAVPIEHVNAILPHVGPVIRDIIRLLVATGARPSEILNMRGCDIERSNPEVWVYRPSSHKTKWKGQKREIPLLPAAQEIVANYLNRKPDSFLFSPKESVEMLRAKQKAECTGWGSYKKPVENPKRLPGEKYDVHALTRSITRACEVAKVPRWTAYQLRHAVGTFVGEKLRLEDVKSLLGHSNISTTQRYAKNTMMQAVNAARSVPTLNNDRGQ
jgi:integrase